MPAAGRWWESWASPESEVARRPLELTGLDATRRWRVLSVGGLSHGAATPFLVISELLRRVFRIEDTDNLATMDAKVAATIRSEYLELAVDLAPLRALLDMPVDDAAWDRLEGPERHRRTLEAVTHLVLLESRRRPVLLVIEDLHWIDTETQVVLNTLVESLPAAQVLLIVNYRPEYRHEWGTRTYYSQLRIDPLSPDGAQTVLRELLGSDASLRPVMQRLLEQAGGIRSSSKRSSGLWSRHRRWSGSRGVSIDTPTGYDSGPSLGGGGPHHPD